MNNEKMSDFEINKLVAENRSLIVNDDQDEHLKENPSSVIVNCITESWEFDPCNNLDDAWPIIESIWPRLCEIAGYDFGLGFGLSTTTTWEAASHKSGGRKLRAAMIIYLITE